MASPGQKRRWIENNSGMSIPSRPPLKKRFTSNVNIATSSVSTSGGSGSPPSAVSISSSPITSSSPPSILTKSKFTTTTTTTTTITTNLLSLEDIDKTTAKSYSKNAWLKQLRKAKVECNSLENKESAIENELINLEATKGIIRIQWNMIQQSLYMIAKSNLNIDTTMPDDLPEEINDTDKNWLKKSHSTAEEFQMMILEYIKTWMESARKLEIEWQHETDSKKHALLSEWLIREIKKLRTSYNAGKQLLHDTKQQQTLLGQQTNQIIKYIKMALDDFGKLQTSLEEQTSLLMQAEKKNDRSKSKVIESVSNGGIDCLTEDFLNPNNNEEKKQQQITTVSTSTLPSVPNTPSSATVSSTVSSTTDNNSSTSNHEIKSSIEQNIKSLLAEHQLIIDARNKELSDLKSEKQALFDEIDRLKIQMAQIPEERLLNTDYFKNLQSSYGYYRQRAHHLEQMRNKLDRTLDDLVLARKIWVDDLKAEKTSQSTTLDSEMKKLENDLIRIRGQRDHFQNQYDDETAKEDDMKETNQRIIRSAKDQKEYIISLEKKLEEYKSNTTVAGPLKDDLEHFEELQSYIDNIKFSLEYLNEIGLNWSLNESQQSVNVLTRKIQTLQNQLDFWKIYDNDSTEQSTRIKSLKNELYSLKKESEKLSLMIDMFEKTESQLLDEIDRMATVYGQLEEQGSKKVFLDDYKQDYKAKLLLEKSKFAQTFSSLVAAKEKQLTNVTNLRLTSEKQKELLQQIKEREKTLDLQLSGKENEALRLAQSVEGDKLIVDSLTQQLEESKSTADQLEEYLTELQNVLKEKTQAYEEEKQLQDRVEESHEKMKRKWDMISQGNHPQEQQLVEECDELRSLLKCSTCRTRFRSHLLIRCMHTFCKKCIDDRLETRQRRCPTCSESFGASDVKQFYL
ncbi:unnamed protein product [Cunninghamella echinulata]